MGDLAAFRADLGTVLFGGYISMGILSGGQGAYVGEPGRGVSGVGHPCPAHVTFCGVSCHLVDLPLSPLPRLLHQLAASAL